MNINELKELIELLNESNISELKLESEEFKLKIRTKHYHSGKAVPQQVAMPMPMSMPQQLPPMATAAPVSPVAEAATSATTTEKSADTDAKSDNHYIFKSPMIGTFYRSSSPDKPPYIKIGDTINVGSVVCIIEAMKLFNEIESEISGTIVKVLVDDMSPVEYDQPLFLVDPN